MLNTDECENFKAFRIWLNLFAEMVDNFEYLR